MEYHIFCRKTHKLLTVYTNKETLKNLDLSKCYYKEHYDTIEKPKQAKARYNEYGIPVRSSNTNNDHLNIFSTHAVLMVASSDSSNNHNDNSSYSSSSCSGSGYSDSSSSSSYSDSSSSSCDSSF